MKLDPKSKNLIIDATRKISSDIKIELVQQFVTMTSKIIKYELKDVFFNIHIENQANSNNFLVKWANVPENILRFTKGDFTQSAQRNLFIRLAISRADLAQLPTLNIINLELIKLFKEAPLKICDTAIPDELTILWFFKSYDEMERSYQAICELKTRWPVLKNTTIAQFLRVIVITKSPPMLKYIQITDSFGVLKQFIPGRYADENAKEKFKKAIISSNFKQHSKAESTVIHEIKTKVSNNGKQFKVAIIGLEQDLFNSISQKDGFIVDGVFLPFCRFLIRRNCKICHSFTHTSSATNICRNFVCGYCARTDHKTFDCRYKNDPIYHRCVNCLKEDHFFNTNKALPDHLCQKYMHSALDWHSCRVALQHTYDQYDTPEVNIKILQLSVNRSGNCLSNLFATNLDIDIFLLQETNLNLQHSCP